MTAATATFGLNIPREVIKLFRTSTFKTLGIDSREEFSDAEYTALVTQYPDINALWVLHKNWAASKAQLESKQAQLASTQAANAALPDNTEEITTLTAYIADIDTLLADPETGLADKIKYYRPYKAEYEVQVAELQAAQTPVDTSELEAEIATIVSIVASKLSDLNALASQMGLDDYV